MFRQERGQVKEGERPSLGSRQDRFRYEKGQVQAGERTG